MNMVALNGISNTFSFSIRAPAEPDQSIESTTPLPVGLWSHVAVSLSGTTATLYLNGVVVGTKTNMSVYPFSLGTTTKNYLGHSQFAADPKFDGLIDEFRIFNRGLSAAEVATLAGPVPLMHLRFDETTGSIAADSSGNGLNGILVGGSTFDTGRINRAVSLSGTDQLVTLPAGVVSACNDFTVTAWVKPDTLGTWTRIFDLGTGTNNYMSMVALNGFTNTLSFSIRTPTTGDQYIDSSTPLTVGVWSHVAIAQLGNTATLYLNGVSVGTNNSMTLRPSDLGTTSQNYLGKSQFSDPHFDGLIDEFQIFARALSGSDISSLAIPPVIESWRQTWFGTTANSGNAANDFDFDNDGLVNLLEFAFGLNPALSSLIQIPQPELSGGNLGFSFNTPPGVSGIIYGAEWSATMTPMDWHGIANTGTGNQHVFNLPVSGNPRRFLRLKVASDP